MPGKGWVADDIHSESASRTLDYACEFLTSPPSHIKPSQSHKR